MAETLGMLCDKLTIVKLKEYHTDDAQRLESLKKQALQLQSEIDEYVADSVSGHIKPDRMVFSANKVFKKEGNEVADITGDFGALFSKLAEVNCQLWHEQEKVYEFETVKAEDKNYVVKQLAVLNLQRNKCIDGINQQFKELIEKNIIPKG